MRIFVLLLAATSTCALRASTVPNAKSILDSLAYIIGPEDQANYLLNKIMANDLYDLKLQEPLLDRLEAIAIEHRMPEKLVTAYTARGYILVLVPDYYKAMQYFRRAHNLSLSQKGRDWEIRKLKTAINIAGVYAEIGDFDKAAEYNSGNVILAERLKDTVVLADVYQAVAVNAMNRLQIDSSILFAEKAIALYEKLGFAYKKHISETTLAEAYGKSGKREQTQKINQRLDTLIQYYSSPPNLELLATMYGTATKNYLFLGENEQAYTTARSALSLLDSTDTKVMNAYRLTIYQSLSEIFKQRNQIDSAYHYLSLATRLKETLIDEKRIREIAAVESAFLIQEKDTTIGELSFSNKKNQATIFWLTVALILFFLMTSGILWLYFNLSKKKKQLSQLKEQLIQTNDKLKSAISQRQQYVSLIVHDIKSPLFSAHINTQILSKKATRLSQPLDITPLREALSRIESAISKILEIENASASGSLLNIKLFDLNHMLSETINAFSLTAEAKNIRLSYQAPDQAQEVESDYHVLQHAVENVISNAIKYAPTGSVVSVAVNQEKEHAQITIRNAVSSSPSLDTFPKTSSEQDFHFGSWGVGLKLSTTLLKEINGKIWIEHDSPETKAFIVSIPNSLYYKGQKQTDGARLSLQASKREVQTSK